MNLFRLAKLPGMDWMHYPLHALSMLYIISSARTGRVKKKLGVTKDGLTCHSTTGVEKHQKPSKLALSLPEGAQVSFFYSLTSPILSRAPGFAPATHPSCLCSFSSVLLNAIFDCRTVFFPSASHFIATLQSWLLIESWLGKSHNAEHECPKPFQFTMFVSFYCRRIMRLF